MSTQKQYMEKIAKMRAKVNGNSKNQTRSWFSKVIRKIDKFCAKGDRRAQLIKFKISKKTWKVTTVANNIYRAIRK